jgi:hypothetical protein
LSYRPISNTELARLGWELEWRMRITDTRRPAEKRWWYMPVGRSKVDPEAGGIPYQLPGLGWPSRTKAIRALVTQLAASLQISVDEFSAHLETARERCAAGGEK